MKNKNPEVKFCPWCGRIIDFDPYFGRYFCTNVKCNYQSEKIESN